nr:MAG TPA: hypothetical protein [Caudoviricetes sp.]
MKITFLPCNGMMSWWFCKVSSCGTIFISRDF